jgi:hypothetical protein
VSPKGKSASERAKRRARRGARRTARLEKAAEARERLVELSHQKVQSTDYVKWPGTDEQRWVLTLACGHKINYPDAKSRPAIVGATVPCPVCSGRA